MNQTDAVVKALRKPSSFEQSAAERKKTHPEYKANPKPTKPPFVPSKDGILKVDKALYDAGVVDEQPK